VNLELLLPDMTTQKCARTVERICRAIDADALVEVDLEARRLRIRSCEDWREFAAGLAEAGFVPE
jgi:hypothetical protein